VAGDLTELLERWGQGDREAVGDLIPVVYAELHAMSRNCLRNERQGHTLQTTALVHEAYLKLRRMDDVRWQNREQFFAIAAQVLRHILVDHARRKAAQRRGSGVMQAPLEEAFTVPAREDVDLHALDESLDRLAAVDERKARLVELRFFAGLSIEEAAQVCGCSPTTVKRELAFAKAWLYRDMEG
jgi:RNA polymerase sigma factor (TIGR02999 family)